MSSGGDVFKRPKNYTGRWTNEQMNQFRKVTDEPADAVIAEFFEGEGLKANGEAIEPHALLMQLMNDRIPAPEAAAEQSAAELVPISQQLLDQLAQRCPLPTVPPEEVRQGQELFQNYGPEVLLNLACFSLPMAYGAARGAMVLHETGYLENRVQRRLIETTQMVVDVMKPGGLKPGGDGLRTAHEIRLLHAAIRHLIKCQDKKWDTAYLGHPINQEDMAGTLMTFSYVVLNGLHKLGVHVDRDSQEAYLRAWCHIGRTMGLHEDLLPGDLREAQQLTWFIYDRQMGGSKQGRDLMKALLDTMTGNLPRVARWFAPSALRVMMEKDLADKLDVPRHLLSDTVTFGLLHAYAAINNLINIDALGLNPHRWFSKLVIEAVTFIGRGHDRRATFEIPEELHEYWKKPPAKQRP
jgi:mpaB/rubber oxygenase-like protein